MQNLCQNIRFFSQQFWQGLSLTPVMPADTVPGSQDGGGGWES